MLLCLVCCREEGSLQKGENSLINETSPYLLQHAKNPVDWYPWGDDAFEKAKQEDKLVIISIGYSACHWCHVMERESFEDSTVASMMNNSFISVKVDREERPDVDQFYVEASLLMTGKAGWPLNIVALPDGKPIYAGTYFPKDQWVTVLNNIQEFYQENPERIVDQGEVFVQNYNEIVNRIDANRTTVLPDLNSKILGAWKLNLDSENGGLRSSQKFPMPGSLKVLLNTAILEKDTEAISVVKLTLDNMISRGLYDHIGGGFSRYTVDPEWRIPHFEKMLYDNAQLVSLYSIAYRYFKDARYKSVVENTIQFMRKELSAPEESLFYSSLDADSDGEEGKFYTWTYKEIESLFSDEEFEQLQKVFEFSKAGNWEEGKNILWLKNPDSGSIEDETNALTRRLYLERNKRVRPTLDNKILLSWNALAISGFVDAYKALGNLEYKKQAIQMAKEAESRFYNQHEDLWYHLPQSNIVAFLDDLAFLAMSLLDLYEITFDPEYLKSADRIVSYVLKNHSKDGTSLFTYNHKDHLEVSINTTPTDDGVEPSGNGVMAKVMYRMGTLYYESRQEYASKSKEMLESLFSQLTKYPMSYYSWVEVYQAGGNEYEVAAVGEKALEVTEDIFTHYYPNTIYLGGNNDSVLPLLANKKVEGETYIYVCKEKYCKLPVKTAEEAIQLITD